VRCRGDGCSLLPGISVFLGVACYRLLVICEKILGPACSWLLGINVFRVRFCVRWTTLLYMFGSEGGVSGAPLGGRGFGSPFLVYPPLPLGWGVVGRPDGSVFLSYME